MSDDIRPAGDRRFWLLAGAAAAGLSVWASLAASGLTGDYGNSHCAHWACDDPSISLHALVSGHVGEFFSRQPAMGLVSMALRAPAVGIAHASGGSIQDEYRAGALVCLVAASIIVTWLAAFAERKGTPRLTAFAGLVLWTIAIIWARGLFFGHPEEPLAAALLLAAIALASDRRTLAAGVTLGLAIGTKEWALLGAPAVVLAGSALEVRRIVVAALAVTVVALGIMAVGNPSAFHAAHAAQDHGERHTTTPANVWFRFGHKKVVAAQGNVYAYAIYPPKLVGRWCRPFVILLALLLSWLFWRRRGFGSPDVLALVALLLLLRVDLDTQTFSYHLLPMLMALTGWEVLGRRRFPVAATLAMVAFQLTVHQVAPNLSANAFNAIYLAWTFVLAAYLAYAAFVRQTLFSSACSYA